MAMSKNHIEAKTPFQCHNKVKGKETPTTICDLFNQKQQNIEAFFSEKIYKAKRSLNRIHILKRKVMNFLVNKKRAYNSNRKQIN